MLMLSELDITIEKPKAIKSQALVDLLKYAKSSKAEQEIMLVEDNEEQWVLYFDGDSTKNEGSVGIVISNNQGEIFKKDVKLAFPCSHNETKYEPLAMGLDLAKEMKILNLKICDDSNLVIRQLNEDFAIKEPSLIKYREEIQKRL
ncbi:Ribonuclease H [Parasponia andersonii]|uniref:Ribonuclease H n=1 Tax=Parasponia andersonii TaxID=3476 RepID=A0A2P5CCP3_PARAD|nr:Ribonuclease H [Parasponia andersonii]